MKETASVLREDGNELIALSEEPDSSDESEELDCSEVTEEPDNSEKTDEPNRTEEPDSSEETDEPNRTEETEGPSGKSDTQNSDTESTKSSSVTVDSNLTQIEQDEQYARALQAQFAAEIALANTEHQASNTGRGRHHVQRSNGSGARSQSNHRVPSGRQSQSRSALNVGRVSGTLNARLAGGLARIVGDGFRFGRIGGGVYMTTRSRSPIIINGINYTFDDDDTDDEDLPRGLQKSEINRLPTRVFTVGKKTGQTSNRKSGKKALEKSSTTEKYECIVCASDYADGDKLRILPCFHEFHVKCVDRWLRNKSNCPLCRTAVTFDF